MGTELILNEPEVLAELRLGLLADLRSLVDELNTIMDEVERTPGLDINARNRQGARVGAVTRAIEARYALHDTIGFPGEPPAQHTLNGLQCVLGVKVLTERREIHIAQLSCGRIREHERSKVVKSVRLLSVLLRQTDCHTLQAGDDPA
jgi:hypothetical protein